MADTLSCKPIQAFSVEDVAFHVNTVELCLPTSNNKLSKIIREMENDDQICAVLKYVVNGWPKYERDVTSSAKDFYHVGGELSVVDGGTYKR